MTSQLTKILFFILFPHYSDVAIANDADNREIFSNLTCNPPVRVIEETTRTPTTNPADRGAVLRIDYYVLIGDSKDHSVWFDFIPIADLSVYVPPPEVLSAACFKNHCIIVSRKEKKVSVGVWRIENNAKLTFIPSLNRRSLEIDPSVLSATVQASSQNDRIAQLNMRLSDGTKKTVGLRVDDGVASISLASTEK